MTVLINTTDISKYVQESSYKVNQEETYVEWEDAIYQSHRRLARTKVKGSFDLVFVTEDELASFLTLVNDNRAANALIMTVYVMNLGQTVTKRFFYKIKGTKTAQINDRYVYKRYTMELEER